MPVRGTGNKSINSMVVFFLAYVVPSVETRNISMIDNSVS